MGTEHTPTQTPEDEQKWKDGLTTIIKQLRSTNAGKDVRAIAHRIVEFRREFTGDASKTLHLN